MSNVLLISDMPSSAKVALAAMNPILSYCNHQVFNLPTILVSNTFNYGKFEIQDNLEYMKKTYQVWQELEFNFDVICSGYIASKEQREWITEVFKNSNCYKVVDPIMGDNGSLYNGVNEEIVLQMRSLCAHADCIVPNFTEACYLANVTTNIKEVSIEDCKKLVNKLKELGAKSVVITSVPLKNNQHCVVGYSHSENQFFSLTYDHVDAFVPGTGDMFCAVLVSSILNHHSLKRSVLEAMNFIRKIVNSKEPATLSKGILVEQYLRYLD